MYSLQFAAGSPYIFLTLAPSDIHNRFALRLALHDPNKDPIHDDRGQRFGLLKKCFITIILIHHNNVDIFYPHIRAQEKLQKFEGDEKQKMFDIIKSSKTLYQTEIDFNSDEFKHLDKSLLNVDLYQLMTGNCGNTSIAYKILMESVFEILIGIPPTNRTKSLSTPTKGIFGILFCYLLNINN